MFQEKEREAYQDVKAPAELKNRIRMSVEQHRKKVRKQQMMVVAAVACFACILSISGVLDSNRNGYYRKHCYILGSKWKY